MAVSSLSTTFVPSLSLSSKPKLQSLCFLSGNTLRFTNSKPLHSSTVVHAAPEVLSSAETKDVESVDTGVQVCEFSFLPFFFLFIFVHVHLVMKFDDNLSSDEIWFRIN